MIILRAFATFWDFINYVFGTNIISMPPNTYGIFMALAFFVGMLFAFKDLSRKTILEIFPTKTKKQIIGNSPKLSEFIFEIIFGFFIGFKLLGAYLEKDLFVQSPQYYITSANGNFFGGILGALFFFTISYFIAKQKQLPSPKEVIITEKIEDNIFTLVVLAMVGGILGSKIMDAIDNPESMKDFLSNPISSLTSGLSVLGGLWLTAIFFIIYGKIKKWNLLALTDSVAPAFFIAYAVGRLGCQFSGDGCWGISTKGITKPFFIPDLLWSTTYAHNVNNDGVQISNCSEPYCFQLLDPHLPTPLYESIIVSLLFLFIWSVRKRFTFHFGFITGMFLVFNGFERFFIEFIRVNRKYDFLFLNLSQAQYISFIMIIIGILLMIYTYYIKPIGTKPNNSFDNH